MNGGEKRPELRLLLVSGGALLSAAGRSFRRSSLEGLQLPVKRGDTDAERCRRLRPVAALRIEDGENIIFFNLLQEPDRFPAEHRRGRPPHLGGEILQIDPAPPGTATARSMTLASSRTLPGQL